MIGHSTVAFARCCMGLLVGLVAVGISHEHGHEAVAPEPPRPSAAAPLVVISFGGFRHDYLDLFLLKNLKDFYQSGVRAEWLKPSFISDCGVNHQTIVTGLYPAYHGATCGDDYDPAAGRYACGPKFQTAGKCRAGGETVWETNQLRARSVRDGRRTGSVQWPFASRSSGASSSLLDSGLPSDATLRQKFSVLLSWLSPTADEPEHDHSAEHHHDVRAAEDNSKKPSPNLALMYHDEPDNTGHRNGWQSPEMNRTLTALDADFGEFLNNLKTKGLLDKVNIIVLSDHGMADVVGEPVYLSECIPSSDAYSVVHTGPVVSVWPAKDQAGLANLKSGISSKSVCSSRLAVYDGTSMPADYHYSRLPTNDVAPLVLESVRGVPIYANKSSATYRGMHGWNNSWDMMYAIFLASGPAFKKGYVKKGFENVHVYELMCKLLDLTPAANNGTFSAVADLLLRSSSKAGSDEHTTIFTELLVIVGAAAVAGTFVVGACRVQRSFARHAGGGQRRLVGLPGVGSTTNDSRRLLATDSNKQPLLSGGSGGGRRGGPANDSSDEESL